MRIKEETCEVCGGKGLAQLGFMPSVIVDPSEEARWMLAEACIHCGATRESEGNTDLIEKRVRDYANFLSDNDLVDEEELKHLI